MKKEDLKRTAAYDNGSVTQIRHKETVIEKFTTWFRNFIDNAE